MDGANLRETESLANSHDLERVYALNSALSGIDDDFESLEFKNQFVRKILDLLDDQTSTNYTTERIGIDFSSPNIAKPFHVGHLRSTFIGRAISNFLTSSGSDVIRINYLGDWGTQFGLLAAGYEINGNKIGGELTTGKLENLDSPRNRLRQYFEVYVMANELAEKDAAFRQKALDYCTRLENGQDENATQFWRRVVDESLEELKELYSRLYVKFDRWESENAASLPAKNLVKELEKRNLIECRNDGMIGIRLDGESRSQFVPLLKSDGTTLYLTRDIYSAITRFDQLACNKLIYVTDIRQEQHFRLLKQVLAKIGREDVADNITHVRFGRILNMSTRKGRAVFVTDLLDEAAGRAENQVLSTDPKTKTPSGTMERRMVAEQLSSTGLIINDLKKRLTLEYDFNWDHVLDTKKDGGMFPTRSIVGNIWRQFTIRSITGGHRNVHKDFHAPEWDLKHNRVVDTYEDDSMPRTEMRLRVGSARERWKYYDEVVWRPNYEYPDGEPKTAEIFYVAESIRYSEWKLFYPCQLIMGRSVDDADKQLQFVPRKSALIIRDVLKHAVEKAIEENKVEYRSNLWIAECWSRKAFVIKGVRRHARERWGQVQHTFSDIYIRLQEGQPPPHMSRRPTDKDGFYNAREYLKELRARRIKYAL